MFAVKCNWHWERTRRSWTEEFPYPLLCLSRYLPLPCTLRNTEASAPNGPLAQQTPTRAACEIPAREWGGKGERGKCREGRGSEWDIPKAIFLAQAANIRVYCRYLRPQANISLLFSSIAAAVAAAASSQSNRSANFKFPHKPPITHPLFTPCSTILLHSSPTPIGSFALLRAAKKKKKVMNFDFDSCAIAFNEQQANFTPNNNNNK